jgi:hypothetical protein
MVMQLGSKWAARKARGRHISKSPGRLVFREGSRFPGAAREVSEIESPELLLRKVLLLLITLGQPVKYDGVEVDIRIHKVFGAPSLSQASSRCMGAALAWFVPTPPGSRFSTRGKGYKYRLPNMS